MGSLKDNLKNQKEMIGSLKYFLAITSSSSIEAWAIWNEYSWILASIITFSQVITSIIPFLAYKIRINFAIK